MNIGLCGLEFNSENLGCAALSYAFLSVLRQIELKKSIKFNIYVITQEKEIDNNNEMFKNIHFIQYKLKDISSINNVAKVFKNCDYVFDFTAGDSFSDIYGIKRFLKISLLKFMANRHSKLILGPQTYGPYKSKISHILSRNIIKNAYMVYSRDNMSKEYADKLTKKDIKEVIDVAFLLPYNKSEKFSDSNGKVNIGINVSGLLWNGGYKKNNQFALTVDYKQYCISLVKWLLCNDYIVHLIGHVNCKDYAIEDDMRACNELNNIVGGKCYISPVFINPIEAKTYISRLDCLIGARMHATIAAISSECAVIPFAYSRKFNGLYNSINYSYFIDGKSSSTEQAINDTKNYIGNISVVKQQAIKANNIAQLKMQSFVNDLEEILN